MLVPIMKICLKHFQDCAALLSPGLFQYIVGFVGRILLDDLIGD